MGSITKPPKTTLLALALLSMLFTFGLSSVSHAAPHPSFSLDADPASFLIKAGTSGVSTITVTSRNFAGPVVLTVAVSPTGPAAVVRPANITLVSGGTAESNLTVTTTTHTPMGNYTVTVTGTGGGVTRNVPVRVTVTTASDFTMNAYPSSLSTQLGRTAHANITVEATLFQGSISLLASVSPIGPIVVLTPNTISLEGNATATSDLSITAPCDSLPGEYSVVVTGRWRPLTRSANLTLTILNLLDPADCPPDFTLALDRQDLTVTGGQIGVFFVILRGINRFNGTITLEVTIDSPGPRIQLANTRAEIQAGMVASVEVLVQATSTSLGTYSVTVIGVSGDTSHSATIQATIVSASANPPPQTSPTPGGDTGMNYSLPFILLVAAMGALAGATVWAGVSMLRNRGKRTSPELSRVEVRGSGNNKVTTEQGSRSLIGEKTVDPFL